MKASEIVDRTNTLLSEKDNLTETREQLDELVEILQFHEMQYYNKDAPLISDAQYDELFDVVRRWEKEHPDWIRVDSPTQRVGSDLSSDFASVKHYSPMLSLGNSYSLKDLSHFHGQVVSGLESSEKLSYAVEPKLDGGTVVLIYEDDLFIRAATRGNGEEGDEITANIRALPNVPLRANFSKVGIYRAELRAEAVMSMHHFTEVNQNREKEGKERFANPRNAATGGLRMKDPAETAARKLDILVFQMAYAVDKEGHNVLPQFETHLNTIQFLKELGFVIPPRGMNVAEDMQKVLSICQTWEEKRSEYPYEIDGMVVKVNPLSYQQQLGSTSHHPKWAIAFKFKAKQATTRLRDVEFQIGKVGAVTPVAKLDPVPLAGVTVSSASLHNEDFIQSRDLRIGDQVIVERAGDVIPYIVKPIVEARSGAEEKIRFPERCPACEERLERIKDEAAWRCVNPSCPEQSLQRMIHFVSKHAMDIDGLGEKYILLFYERGWLRDIRDIYRLDYQKIESLEGFGVKSAQNLMQAIEQSKKQPIARLLHGLSIHHVGRKMAKVIAERVHHVLDLGEWTEEQLIAIPDVGPIVAENIRAFFQNEHNIVLLRELERLGVNLTQRPEDQEKKVSEDAPLYGKTILFTGTLQHFSRKEAKKLAEDNGAKTLSAVSSNLDILVVGENAGSKLKKARDIGTVAIWSEEEFLNQLS